MRAAVDVSDVVQEVLLKTFLGLNRFEDRGRGALRAFLLKAIINRIRDEQRKVERRPKPVDVDEPALALHDDEPSPYEFALTAEREDYYKRGLSRLSEDERTLIVGRVELGYNYEQLALVAGKATAEAARVAVRRAIAKLAVAIDRLMSDASGN
jgi:RNA polymerase sigma factor (sigma-70 family)